MLRIERVMLAIGPLVVLSAALGLTGCGNATGVTVPGGIAGGLGDSDTARLEDAIEPLLGEWRLLSLAPPDTPPATAPTTGRFTADFRSDGELGLTADCNSCRGEYIAGQGTLEVGPLLACTLAYCVSAPVDSQFTSMMLSSTTWAVDGDTLVLQGPNGRLELSR